MMMQEKQWSRFNEEATIDVESITSPEYISTLTLLKNNDI
jgi:hypothetical protein